MKFSKYQLTIIFCCVLGITGLTSCMAQKTAKVSEAQVQPHTSPGDRASDAGCTDPSVAGLEYDQGTPPPPPAQPTEQSHSNDEVHEDAGCVFLEGQE
jgi:hypothetical protein